MFKITKEWLLSNKTPRGSWNKAQLEAIGVRWPPEKGWQGKIDGTLISDIRRKNFEAKQALNNRKRFDLDWCISQIITNYNKLSQYQKSNLESGINLHKQ